MEDNNSNKITEEVDNEVDNIEELMHNKLASEHSKNAIFFWCGASLIYLLVKGGIAALFSWKTIVFFLLSPFVASFISIPSYLLMRWIAKGISNSTLPQWLIYLYWVFDFIYEPLIAIVVINIIGLP